MIQLCCALPYPHPNQNCMSSTLHYFSQLKVNWWSYNFNWWSLDVGATSVLVEFDGRKAVDDGRYDVARRRNDVSFGRVWWSDWWWWSDNGQSRSWRRRLTSDRRRIGGRFDVGFRRRIDVSLLPLSDRHPTSVSDRQPTSIRRRFAYWVVIVLPPKRCLLVTLTRGTLNGL